MCFKFFLLSYIIQSLRFFHNHELFKFSLEMVQIVTIIVTERYLKKASSLGLANFFDSMNVR